MSDITRITRRDLPTRTSGTVLSEVRRPRPDVPARHREVAERLAAPKVQKPEPKATPKGKASKPESNDADVETSDG